MLLTELSDERRYEANCVSRFKSIMILFVSFWAMDKNKIMSVVIG